MTGESRERGTEAATLSHDPPLTADDQRFAGALADGLGRLRTARPGYQDALEQRLLARLAQPARPWWKRALPARSHTRRPLSGAVRMPRRSFLGLAAASALALVGASIALPLVGTPEVSAREILEKVQANSENPGLAGVKSFHLTAKLWNNRQKPLGEKEGPGPREMLTEQWFVAPDKMRTESRTQDASGKPVVSGMMVSGSDFKHYATTGVTDVFMFGLFAAPIGAKPGEARAVPGTRAVKVDGSPVPGVQGTDGAPAAGVWVAGQPAAEQKPFTVAITTRKREGAGDNEEADQEVFIVGEACAEPKRTGETTIAGRPVFVVENDFSACLPANAPAEMKGRHIRWVDQKTFLPLKMEMYGQDGALVDRYEITSIEYDIAISAKTFTELPAGTSIQEPKVLPRPPKPVAP